MQLDQHARLAETLPWLREPDDEAEPSPAVRRRYAPRTASVDAPTPAPAPVPSRSRRSLAVAYLRSRSPGWGEPLSHRRRAVAVLGVAGILAGGYAVTASAPADRLATADQSTGSLLSEDEWSRRAQVTLVSLDQQLDLIAQTEEAWNSMPENRRAGSLPMSMKAMLERKKLLESRKTALRVQLESYRSLSRTKDELLDFERDLRSVERALEDLPAESKQSSEQSAQIAVLDELRDFRLRQRNNKRGELDGMQRNVESATRAPLADDGQATDEVSGRVMDVIKQDGNGKDPAGTPVPPRPEVVGGRDEQGGQERQDTANSAPPDPRGPRDEQGERRDDPNARAAAGQKDEHGPVGKVVGAVGGVVTGDGGSADPAPSSADAGRSGEKRGGGGLLGKVGDVVDGGNSGSDRKAADTVQHTTPEKAAPQEAAPQEAAPQEAAPKQAASSGGASARSAPPQAPAPASAMTDADRARQAVAAASGGQWMGLVMEAAIAQAERSAAAEGSSSTAPAPSRTAPSSAGSADTGAGNRSASTTGSTGNVVNAPQQRENNTGSTAPSNATTTHTTTDASGTKSVTTSPDGFTVSRESADGSRATVTVPSANPVPSGSNAGGSST